MESLPSPTTIRAEDGRDKEDCTDCAGFDKDKQSPLESPLELPQGSCQDRVCFDKDPDEQSLRESPQGTIPCKDCVCFDKDPGEQSPSETPHETISSCKDCVCFDKDPDEQNPLGSSTGTVLCSCSGDGPLVPIFGDGSEIHLYPNDYNGCELQLCYWQGNGDVDLAAVVLVEVVVRSYLVLGRKMN